jgi:hypothetical protein
MAAVTVNEFLQDGDPGTETIVCTLANTGDTYKSRKFRKLVGCHITQNGTIAATDAYSATSLTAGSGTTITFTAVGTTTPKLMVTLYGRR